MSTNPIVSVVLGSCETGREHPIQDVEVSHTHLSRKINRHTTDQAGTVKYVPVECNFIRPSSVVLQVQELKLFVNRVDGSAARSVLFSAPWVMVHDLRQPASGLWFCAGG